LKKLAKIIDFLYIPWAIKAICVFIFIFNTEIPFTIHDNVKQDNIKSLELYPGHYSVNGQDLSRWERDSKFHLFCEQLYSKAKEKVAGGQQYTPEDYFKNLIGIYEKKNDLKAALSFNQISFMQNLAFEGYRTRGEALVDFDAAREKYSDRLTELEPIYSSKKWSSDITLKGIKDWLARVYWFSFFPALIYFFVIKNEECKGKDMNFSLRSPISFSLALVFYPAVFIYLINRWLKYTYSSIEYWRRRENVFAVLSDDEIARIKIIAQNIPIREIREYFRVQGLTCRHSFAAALLVVLVFSFMPRPVQAKIVDFGDSVFKNIESSWHAPCSKIKAGSNQDQSDILKFKVGDYIFSKPLYVFKDMVCWLVKLEFIFCFQAVCQKIMHVPVFSVIQLSVAE